MFRCQNYTPPHSIVGILLLHVVTTRTVTAFMLGRVDQLLAS